MDTGVCGGVWLTSRGMLGLPWRVQQWLGGVVQLRHAHAENQSLLQVVHHRQTGAVPERHPEGGGGEGVSVGVMGSRSGQEEEDTHRP